MATRYGPVLRHPGWEAVTAWFKAGKRAASSDFGMGADAE